MRAVLETDFARLPELLGREEATAGARPEPVEARPLAAAAEPATVQLGLF
jgi:hypothetical protein